MSAWNVPTAHLHVLVQGLIEAGLITPAEADATGQMLSDENAASVAYRYGRDPVERDYRFIPSEVPMHVGVTIDALDCFMYQCAEGTEYAKRPGWKLCQDLYAVIGMAHGDLDAIQEAANVYVKGADGYDRRLIPWGIDSWRDAIDATVALKAREVAA